MAAYLSAGGSTSGATEGTKVSDFTEAASEDDYAIYEAKGGTVVLAATRSSGTWSISTVTAC